MAELVASRIHTWLLAIDCIMSCDYCKQEGHQNAAQWLNGRADITQFILIGRNPALLATFNVNIVLST